MEFGFGFGMGIGASFSPSLAAASASVHPTNYGTNSPAYLYGLPSAGTSRVDDLLDFSGHDVYSSAAASENHILQHPQAALVGEQPGFSYNSHSHSHASSFADEIYIPSEEAAELEWLSKFVEDSFTDTPSYPSTYFPTAAQIKTEQTTNDAATAGSGRGARSRRPRSPQLPNQSSSSSSTSSSSSSDFPQQMHGVDNGNNHASHSHIRGGGDGVRRCTHCASEKTPQWRTGPLGPKTLCNACGVRYKSGRLVPEYRPAASPTFVLTQHSNSHRKVVELRRQKEQLHGIVRHENHSSNY